MLHLVYAAPCARACGVLATVTIRPEFVAIPGDECQDYAAGGDGRQDTARQTNPQPATDPITQLPGFRGNFQLLNRATGKGLIIGPWETEADLRASMALHQEAHQQSAAAGSGSRRRPSRSTR